jgi:glutaminyl-peptide cyclotransferase
MLERSRFLLAWLIITLSIVIVSCSGTGDPNPGPIIPETLYVDVIGTLPHDTTAYTQGFEIHDSILWESTGLYGSSTLRKLDLSDGSIIETYPLPDTLFAEGITVLNEKVYQLTWQSGLVLEWDIQNPVLQVSDTIDTEGWGICSVSSSTVVTSDGSSTLSFRDINSFDTLRTINANINGGSINLLNELEYVRGSIYANRYYSDNIYQIDPQTGNVAALIDASSLLSISKRINAGALNGIAWDPEREAFLLTGKNWPTIFIVTF